eukprot:GEZU01001269.1.p1 GENE.GEZU01001269.1~~GEZU01001269.1.p1  ORF type:complete len:487 (+),score=148.26 GEZU01001269.1:95-1462(+)
MKDYGASLADVTQKYFGGIPEIKYEGPSSKNVFAFKYYNPNEIILGKPMKDHLRFAVCYWHTFRGEGTDMFGSGTWNNSRPWEDRSDSLENALRRMRVNFAFLKKLGVEYWCFHDRDIAPEGKTLAETNKNLDAVVQLAKQLQKETGIKLLWGTANLFSHPIYMNGAATNPDAYVFAHAAAQVKKAMEVTKELGGENYVFWGGREGYQTLLNTDMKRELNHMATFLRMARDHKNEIGFSGTLLIEPKPREPTKHQYDFDAATVIGFLKEHGLDKDFKLNIECNHATLAGHTFEHELTVCANHDMLGSIDANYGDTLLGWDTDLFPMDIKSTTLAMMVVLKHGGFKTGGLNFDCKLRRESTDIEDMFIAHIGAMDSFARGLRNAAKILEERALDSMIEKRYLSWDSGIGAAIESGEIKSFAELEKWVHQQESKAGPYVPQSGKQEKYEVVFNDYLK